MGFREELYTHLTIFTFKRATNYQKKVYMTKSTRYKHRK